MYFFTEPLGSTIEIAILVVIKNSEKEMMGTIGGWDSEIMILVQYNNTNNYIPNPKEVPNVYKKLQDNRKWENILIR